MREPSIGQLNRVLKLCSANDVITKGVFRLARTDIRDMWAMVVPVRPSNFSQEGLNSQAQPTHRATVRAVTTVDLTVAAWAFEGRTLSADLWYKIVGYRESPNGQWWELDLRIYSRDEQVEPSTADMGLGRKQGVPL